MSRCVTEMRDSAMNRTRRPPWPRPWQRFPLGTSPPHPAEQPREASCAMMGMAGARRRGLHSAFLDPPPRTVRGHASAEGGQKVATARGRATQSARRMWIRRNSTERKSLAPWRRTPSKLAKCPSFFSSLSPLTRPPRSSHAAPRYGIRPVSTNN